MAPLDERSRCTRPSCGQLVHR